jgi:hypothetical protein
MATTDEPYEAAIAALCKEHELGRGNAQALLRTLELETDEQLLELASRPGAVQPFTIEGYPSSMNGATGWVCDLRTRESAVCARDSETYSPLWSDECQIAWDKATATRTETVKP